MSVLIFLEMSRKGEINRQGPSVHRSFRRAHEYAESALQIVNNPSGIGLTDDAVATFIGFGSEDFWNKARNPTKHTMLHDMIENYHIFA